MVVSERLKKTSSFSRIKIKVFAASHSAAIGSPLEWSLTETTSRSKID